MYHAIESLTDFTVDLEISPTHHLERLLIRAGDRLRAQIRPHVTETAEGPIEVADLFFEDGTVTRTVPFSYFQFVEVG